MNCKEIIKKHLIDNGYDGLCNLEIDCGCGIDELMECDCCKIDIDNCEPAFKRNIKCEDCEFGEGKWCYNPDGKIKECFF